LLRAYRTHHIRLCTRLVEYHICQAQLTHTYLSACAAASCACAYAHSPAAVSRSARYPWRTGMLHQHLNRVYLICSNATLTNITCGRACTSLSEQLILYCAGRRVWYVCAHVVDSVQACSGQCLTAQECLQVCRQCKGSTLHLQDAQRRLICCWAHITFASAVWQHQCLRVTNACIFVGSGKVLYW
jgi:hypothetical protein